MEEKIMKLSSCVEDNFELTNFENLDDEGFKCQLNLVSGPFAADIFFWFDISSAKEVVKCIENIYENLRGEAKLGSRMSILIFDLKAMD
jgi:hypothetical protein